MKTSADRSTRSLSIGTLNIHIVAHRFFHIVDARHWHQVETFHHYRDISLSAQRHADIYKADLERISDHDSVPGPLRKTASNLLKHFKNDEFVDKFSKITDMVGERRANRGVRSLLFGVAENVGAPPGKKCSKRWERYPNVRALCAQCEWIHEITKDLTNSTTCVAPSTAGCLGSKRSWKEGIVSFFISHFI